MSLNLYSLAQINEKLSALNSEEKYDVHTLLNAFRLEKIVPIFWFDGCVSDFILPEVGMGWEDTKYTSIAPFKGFVGLNQQLYASKLKELFNGKLEYIHVDFGQFFYIYDGEGIIESPTKNKRLFPYNVVECDGLELPFTAGLLFNNNIEPGLKVYKDDLYFFKEQVDNFISPKTDIVHDLKLEVEELKYQVEQLQEQNEYLLCQVNKIHPALDPDDSRFAPEVYIALKMCDFIHDRQQQQISENGKADSHTSLAEEFYKINGLNIGDRNNLMKRLTTVSNFSKKDSSFINLAKSIK